MRRVLVLLVVGLTRRQLGPDAPNLAALAKDGFAAPIEPVLPAVTCSVQATYLTGAPPRVHGVVGNGWYYRDRAEVALWKQARSLVQAPMVWEAARARDPKITCAQLFWWFNMFSGAEWSVTPRPAYLADGRKLPDVYSEPPELRRRLLDRLGPFPLFDFWGPRAGLPSTRWIVDAALDVLATEKPGLTFVYLPHLDYDHQRFGPPSAGHPRSAEALREVDREVGRLLEAARRDDLEVLVVSEYGIEPVSGPVHVNRVLREAGYLRPWVNLEGSRTPWELLEPGACRAFAVADHQVAHVHVRDAADLAPVKALLERTDGVERVLDAAGKAAHGLDHPRAGDLVAVAAPGRWFTYYYWLDDALAPDFARTVEIHKKPGYDPCELLLDPARPLVKGRVAWTLLKKALGFRYVMDVIPLDATLVKGSHGRPPTSPEDGAVLLSSSRDDQRDAFAATAIHDLILTRLGVSG
ncbi:MAG: alkaline phosphatase family protein [Planctomycetes bacterium]|nr:alkaline phosphatase family protein [Planctomycetota bacterium]